MILTDIAEKLFPMLALLLVGFLAAKLKTLDENSNKVIARLVMDITMPCSILYSVFGAERPLSKTEVLALTLVACAAIALLLLYSALTERMFALKSEQRGATRYMVIFWSAMIGYPMVKALYGSQAVFPAAVFCTVFMLLSYTYGVKLTGGVNRKRRVRDVMLTPIFLCAIVGYVGYLLDISLPPIVLDTLSIADGATGPLSMLAVGCALALTPVKELKGSLKSCLILFLRMTFFPIICYFIMSALGLPKMINQITAVCLAMPPAPSTAIMCARYGGNQSLAVTGVFVSTLFSFVLLPVLLLLMQ